MSAQMHLALLISATGNHQGAWRQAGSNLGRVNEPAFFVDLVRKAEAACIDAVFFADVPYTNAQALAANPVTNSFEPLVFSAYLAAVTRHIGLVSSVSTSFTEPFNVARHFAGIDALSGGRAGWNIVTSALGERNYGAAPLPDQDTRYARAAEYLEVAKRLWDGWDAEIIAADRARGLYARPEGVRPADFHGRFFDVEGPMTNQRPPQGWPVLFQAGASGTGRDFAARYAEGVFTSGQTLAESLAFTRDLKARAAGFGRDPQGIKVLNGITPLIAETADAAAAKARELAGFINIPAAIKRLNTYAEGVDLTHLDPDRPIPKDFLPPVASVQGRQSRYAIFHKLATEEGWTLRQLAELTGRSDGHWVVIGAPEQVADQMEERFRAGAGEGYVVMPTDHPESSDLFLRQVVPILQARGLFRDSYPGKTLRETMGLAKPPRHLW